MNQEVYGVGFDPVPDNDPIGGIGEYALPLTNMWNSVNNSAVEFVGQRMIDTVKWYENGPDTVLGQFGAQIGWQVDRTDNQMVLETLDEKGMSKEEIEAFGSDGGATQLMIANIENTLQNNPSFPALAATTVGTLLDIDCVGMLGLREDGEEEAETNEDNNEFDLPEGFEINWTTGELITPKVEGIINSEEPSTLLTNFAQSGLQRESYVDSETFTHETMDRVFGYLTLEEIDLDYIIFPPKENSTGINITTINGISSELRINQDIVSAIIDALEVTHIPRDDKHIGNGIVVLTSSEQTNGRNIIDGNIVSTSAVHPDWNDALGGASIGLTSVIITGDTFKDLSALGTELSQLYLFSEEYQHKHIEAESISNSFGMGVACSWYGVSYSDYVIIMNQSAGVLNDGTVIPPTPVSEGIYELLEETLRDRPDLFIKGDK
jgi:hypothetical protein